MYDELVKALRGFDYYCRQISQNPSGIFGQAADAIEELCGLCANQSKDCSEAVAKYLELWANQPRWIPVTERLPDRGEPVLVYRRADNRVQPKMRIDVCPYLGDGIFCLLGVTYWMPLPEPPKEGET